MTIVMIIMFKSKSLKRYAKLLIPYILSLIIVMIYAGLNIHYIGDGFVLIKEEPFYSVYIYKNRKGKTIIRSYEWLCKRYDNYHIVFKNIGNEIVYNEEGECILRKPTDDEPYFPGIQLYDSYYYTSKSFNKGDYHDYERIRFYDMDGNYLITQEYRPGFYPDNESNPGELINEYKEEVIEYPGGVKRFNPK